MSWQPYLTDTTTGRLIHPIDLPGFSWTITIDDASLTTTPSHQPGQSNLQGINLPWSALPNAHTPQERDAALASDKRSIALLWRDPWLGEETVGTPIVSCVIGPRTDTWQDTSFSLDSILTLLGNRYAVEEGAYATGPNHTSPGTLTYKNMSFRGIASEVGHVCTNLKPGGTLPIDWQYRGEKGTHERTYEAWNVQNLSCKAILEKIAGVIGGPDMQFRPYLTDDGQHVRHRFIAGSDTDIHLGQDTIHRLDWAPTGSTMENLKIDHLGPIHRIYGSGAGTDKAQTCALAEDLTLVRRDQDPWPLRESTYSDSDTEKPDLLKSHTKASLDANRKPLMQISCDVDMGDMDASGATLHPLGSIWPGEVVELAIEGFPTLPDDVYECRLMEMSGTETTVVHMVFDAMDDPLITF